MADIPGAQTELPVGITGLNSSGVPTNLVNADSNGNLNVVTPSSGSVTPGTAASKSTLIGAQFNVTRPTLTNNQQVAIQTDSSGNILIATLDPNMTGSLGALNATLNMASDGMTSFESVVSGTWVGTIVFEGSIDGTNYIAVTTLDRGNNFNDVTTSGITTNTSVTILASGFQDIRARMSAYTSGSATVYFNLSQGGPLVAAVISKNAANLNAQVVGNIASGSTDSGNPIKAGAVYNSSLPTPSSGQRVDLQSNQFGELAVISRNKYRNIHGASTTTIKSGSGRLHSITMNSAPSAPTMTIYDNTAGSGTTIATISAGTGSSSTCFTLLFDCEFSTGLTVVTTVAGGDWTVMYE